MAVKEPTGGLKKACWKGYTAVGMKMKNGRKVPNCVPVSEEECPVRRQYKELKKMPIKDLRDRIKQSSRVVDVSGFDKESAISHILRRQHGDKRVDQAFGLDEEKENYGLPAHSIKHVMQKIKDGHWEVSSGEVKSGQHLSIIDHTKGKKKRMIHVKEEPMNEQTFHRIGVTVSDDSVKSGDKILKMITVPGADEAEAQKNAAKKMRKYGFTVHDTYHHSTITRVKEETEQMDEGLTKSKNKKAKRLIMGMKGRKKLGPVSKDLTWQQNVAQAVKAGRAMAKEEVEQIDELKRDTLISYVGKAYADKKRRKGKNAVAAMTGTLDDYLKGAKKSDNRSTGITRAYARLNKEEVEQISEKSEQARRNKTMKNLRFAALGAKAKRRMVVPDPEPQHKTAQAHNKAIGRGLEGDSEDKLQTPHHIGVTSGSSTSGPRLGTDIRSAHQNRNVVKKGDRAGKLNKGAMDSLKRRIRSRMTEEAEKIDEVLSKDASAGDWIHDFVHSKNPKFAGKSKQKRMKMALAAYYAKQRNEEVEQMDEMKSSNPKGLAYKITAASHAANPSYGPHDPSVDPKTNFGAGATRSSAVAGLRAARAIKKAGGNPHDPEHIETISKAIHGSPADYGGKSRGWSHHALTSTNQSPEQKERRSKLTGAYGGLSDDEKEKDRQIARVIAKRVHPVKESVGRDATKQLIARIKKAGGNAKRNKAGLLVTKKKSKAKLEEATGEDVYKDLRAQGVPHHVAMSRAKEHEERSKSRDYQGYHTQIHVDGRHYKAGDRMGAGEKGAQDAGRHAANIAKKTGKKVSLHMIHHETGKTLAIADHEDGKWKYRNLSEAAPIQKQPKAGVEKLVSKMNPDTKAKTVSETRNIIREVIRKAVDKQGTNQANGKTATGSRAAKIEIDPVISLDANRGGVRGI